MSRRRLMRHLFHPDCFLKTVWRINIKTFIQGDLKCSGLKLKVEAQNSKRGSPGVHKSEERRTRFWIEYCMPWVDNFSKPKKKERWLDTLILRKCCCMSQFASRGTSRASQQPKTYHKDKGGDKTGCGWVGLERKHRRPIDLWPTKHWG